MNSLGFAEAEAWSHKRGVAPATVAGKAERPDAPAVPSASEQEVGQVAASMQGLLHSGVGLLCSGAGLQIEAGPCTGTTLKVRAEGAWASCLPSPPCLSGQCRSVKQSHWQAGFLWHLCELSSLFRNLPNSPLLSQLFQF